VALANGRRPLYCRRRKESLRRAFGGIGPSGIRPTGVRGLLDSITEYRAAARAVPRTLRPLLSRHRAITRVAVAFLSLAIAMAVSFEGATAGPTQPPTRPTSILPQNVGVGLLTSDPVSVTFEEPMDPTSVDAALIVRPRTAIRTIWRAGGRTLLILPRGRWQTDARYVITVDANAQRADGSPLGTRQQVSFTTETAPIVSDFELRYVEQPEEPVMRALTEAATRATAAADLPPPSDTTSMVSTGTTITIGFSSPMDRREVERLLVVSPQIEGTITWSGNSLVFTPVGRLEPNARYALTVAGAHDLAGNRLGGDASFSFTTRAGAQVVKVSPLDGEKNLTNVQVAIWFSQPVDTAATGGAFRFTDATTGEVIPGQVVWNEAGTQLRFGASHSLAKGHLFRMSFADGARDSDGNIVSGSWSFQTKAPPPPPARAPTTVVRRPAAAAAGPAAPADMIQYAVWQINQSRAAYGFGPLSLDSAISAVASAHAWDMITYGYFSHTGRDGSSVSTRLSRAGIGFSASGENICYLGGAGIQGALNWCHATFMSEPYPGYANHIGNILGTRYSRVGVGIAQSGAKVIIVWDFAG
jgi:uncharacterized protein YkwD